MLLWRIKICQIKYLYQDKYTGLTFVKTPLVYTDYIHDNFRLFVLVFGVISVSHASSHLIHTVVKLVKYLLLYKMGSYDLSRNPP